MVDFARSERSTLGVEWELGLVDSDSLELVPRAGEVLASVAADPALESRVVSEMLTNTIEVVSGVHQSVAGVREDLHDAVSRVREITDELGISLFSAGTHPFSRWAEQQVTDMERYAELINRTQWWGRHMLIFGVHTHVGIDDRDKVLPILNALLAYVPHLQAVSASSPYWGGENTGYASNRAMLFQQLPTAGLPYQFDSWAAYERYAHDMLTTGVIDRLNEIRWDIRPSPGWGTIEVRVCDAMPTLAEVSAVTAFVQCLVDDFSARLDAGETLPTMPDWFHFENKWRAARYGMEAIIIETAEARERVVTTVLAEEIARLIPVAERLGCERELTDMLRFAEVGASYQRQSAEFARSGDLHTVAGLLCEELTRGTPFGPR